MDSRLGKLMQSKWNDFEIPLLLLLASASVDFNRTSPSVINGAHIAFANIVVNATELEYPLHYSCGMVCAHIQTTVCLTVLKRNSLKNDWHRAVLTGTPSVQLVKQARVTILVAGVSIPVAGVSLLVAEVSILIAGGLYSGCRGFSSGCMGFHSGCRGFSSGCRGSHSDCWGLYSGCRGFHSGCRGFSSGCRGFHSDCRGFYFGCRGFRSDCRGFCSGCRRQRSRHVQPAHLTGRLGESDPAPLLHGQRQRHVFRRREDLLPFLLLPAAPKPDHEGARVTHELRWHFVPNLGPVRVGPGHGCAVPA